MSKTKKIESPTKTLLDLEIGESVLDLKTHLDSVRGTRQRIKDKYRRNFSCIAISDTEIEITRTK